MYHIYIFGWFVVTSNLFARHTIIPQHYSPHLMSTKNDQNSHQFARISGVCSCMQLQKFLPISLKESSEERSWCLWSINADRPRGAAGGWAPLLRLCCFQRGGLLQPCVGDSGSSSLLHLWCFSQWRKCREKALSVAIYFIFSRLHKLQTTTKIGCR